MNLNNEFDATPKVNRNAGFRSALEALQAALDDLAASEAELRDARRLLDEPEEPVGLRLAVAAGNVGAALAAALLNLSPYDPSGPGVVAWSPAYAVAMAVLSALFMCWRRRAVVV